MPSASLTLEELRGYYHDEAILTVHEYETALLLWFGAKEAPAAAWRVMSAEERAVITQWSGNAPDSDDEEGWSEVMIVRSHCKAEYDPAAEAAEEAKENAQLRAAAEWVRDNPELFS